MQVLAVHADVIVATSRIYQTTCTLVRRGTEAFCIDSPILPDELELLPTVAQQSDFNVVAVLATHADWDHLLGRLAFRVPLGVAETTATALNADPSAPLRELKTFDDEHYIVRPTPLELGTPQILPVPGRCGLGPGELDLYPLGGHTPDGMAIWVPWARVLVVGDHLSPVEIPMLGGYGPPAPLDAYLATLDRLQALVERAETIIPGHGEPLTSERALALLREDRAYLRALATDGGGAELPIDRRTDEQRKIHQRNAVKI